MKKRILVVVLFLTIVSAAVYLIRQIRVLELVCSNAGKDCSGEINGFLMRYRDRSYIEIKDEVSRELSHNPLVAHYTIRFELPNRLSVDIVERVPKIAAKFGEERYFIFDSEGVSLGEVKETNLPVVMVYELPKDSKFRFAIVLAQDVVRYYGAENIRVDKSGLYARVRDSEVAFPLEGDRDVILGSLEITLSQLNRVVENSKIVLTAGNNYRIDLRYKNPVVGL